MGTHGSGSRDLDLEMYEVLLNILKTRFEENLARHREVEWASVLSRLEASPDKLLALREMEISGGEPDVTGQDKATGRITFIDCSAESPRGRRNICYDQEALEHRKEHKPQNSAGDMAAAMGVEILSEAEYRDLQKLGEFDTRTSSWIKTPAEVRKLGGALFADRRYGRVFVYHNGAESYYGVRGFRGILRV
jgi:hypothetical protein